MKYAVIFEKTKTGYSAHVPDLPGCVAAARTLKSTEKLMREAIELHLESMKEHGEVIPSPVTETGYILVPREFAR
jgi:predicted RNase H-like HicB family nuclease